MRRVECIFWKERWAPCHSENVHPLIQSNANALIPWNMILLTKGRWKKRCHVFHWGYYIFQDFIFKKMPCFPRGYYVFQDFIFIFTFLVPGIMSVCQCRWTGIRSGLLHWILCWLLQSFVKSRALPFSITVHLFVTTGFLPWDGCTLDVPE